MIKTCFRKDLFHLYGQEGIAVADGRLYYCDVLRGNALCSYRLETKETRFIEEAEGVIEKTGTGVYYIVENVVYRIKEDDLVELCQIPSKKFTFIDCYEDAVYWIGREKKSEDKGNDRYTLEYVYKKELSRETEPKLLFHRKEEDIRDAVIAKDCLYLMTDQGIYRTGPEKEELKKISEISGLEFLGDDTCVFIEESLNGKRECYYEVTPEGESKRLTENSGNTATLFETELYYPWGNQLYKVSLGREEVQEVPIPKVPDYFWCVMEAYEGGVFMRVYLSYDIWHYDAGTGAVACVIKQWEE